MPFAFIPAAGAGADPKPGPVADAGAGRSPERIACEITFPRARRLPLGDARREPPRRLRPRSPTSRSTPAPSRLEPTSPGSWARPRSTASTDFEAMRAPGGRVPAGRRAARPALPPLRRDRRTGGRPPVAVPAPGRDQQGMDRRVRHRQGRRLRRPAGHGRPRATTPSRRSSTPSCAARAPSRRLHPILQPLRPGRLHRRSSTSTPPRTPSPHEPTSATSPTSSPTAAGKRSWPPSSSSTPEVRAYVKNQGLGFTIPYAIDGQQRAVRARLHRPARRRPRRRRPPQPDRRGVAAPGDATRSAKVATARDLWFPAVNNHGGFGRWAFVEVTDIADAIGTIDAAVGRPRCRADGTVEGSS